MTEYHTRPSILILGDSEAAFARARQGVEGAGCRVADCVDIDAAADRIDRQVAADAIFIELDRDHGAALDRLLERIDAYAGSGRYRSVISAPPELIDAVAARALHSDVIHLCAPSILDRSVSIHLACQRPEPSVHDIDRGQRQVNGTANLQKLSEEVGRIAGILATLSNEGPVRAEIRERHGDTAEAVIDAASIRHIIRARRLRDRYFHSELFADPAWDMLLDLMAARLDGQRVAVSSLCIAAAVPATTALRWIKSLTEHGMFVRTADPQDGRRVFIELSDKAAGQLSDYLSALHRLAPLTI